MNRIGKGSRRSYHGISRLVYLRPISASFLKWMLKGTYVSAEPFHLFRYLDEETFRYFFGTRRAKARMVT